MEDLLRIGVVSSTHGIAGELKIFPTTDDPARYKKLKKCILKKNKEELELDVAGVKFFKNMVIIRFRQFSSINEVEKYKGAEIWVTRENAISLKKDEYFICDLIGLKAVEENGNQIGILTDVLQTGANDVYEITDTNGKKYLFPAIKQCILGVDLAKGIIKVHVMKGLLDL